jgi:hypothetical protein
MFDADGREHSDREQPTTTDTNRPRGPTTGLPFWIRPPDWLAVRGGAIGHHRDETAEARQCLTQGKQQAIGLSQQACAD